jgi:hypothetical protein
MRHATTLLYHVCAVASRNIRFASCGTSGKLTLWTCLVLYSICFHLLHTTGVLRERGEYKPCFRHNIRSVHKVSAQTGCVHRRTNSFNMLKNKHQTTMEGSHYFSNSSHNVTAVVSSLSAVPKSTLLWGACKTLTVTHLPKMKVTTMK